MNSGYSTSNLDGENISALAEIFDLLSKFDFELSQDRDNLYPTQEIKKGSSITRGESFLESCDIQDKNSKT